jgi:hypothetical protein
MRRYARRGPPNQPVQHRTLTAAPSQDHLPGTG